jgi:hypothetical protein
LDADHPENGVLFARRFTPGCHDRADRPGLRWADLLRRVYDIDRRTCPNCGLRTLEPIATILDPDAIAGILGAIGRRSRAPPG